jgi:hypothetical protein
MWPKDFWGFLIFAWLVVIHVTAVVGLLTYPLPGWRIQFAFTALAFLGAAIALPLYLQLCSDLSKSGRDRPSLPEVFKTVSSAWFVTLVQRRKGPNSRQGQETRIAQGWATASKEESWKPKCSWESMYPRHGSMWRCGPAIKASAWPTTNAA